MLKKEERDRLKSEEILQILKVSMFFFKLILFLIRSHIAVTHHNLQRVGKLNFWWKSFLCFCLSISKVPLVLKANYIYLCRFSIWVLFCSNKITALSLINLGHVKNTSMTLFNFLPLDILWSSYLLKWLMRFTLDLVNAGFRITTFSRARATKLKVKQASKSYDANNKKDFYPFSTKPWWVRSHYFG